MANIINICQKYALLHNSPIFPCIKIVFGIIFDNNYVK